MLSYVTESPVILDRPLSRTTLFVFLLYTASNKNVKQQSILVYIPNYLYPTPSASGKITCYTSCTPSYNRRQAFTAIHSTAKTQKSKSDFFVFQSLLYLFLSTRLRPRFNRHKLKNEKKHIRYLRFARNRSPVKQRKGSKNTSAISQDL